jgi:hypothetical protein
MEQGSEFTHNFDDGGIGKAANQSSRTRPPIQALDLVGEDNAGDGQASRLHNLY